jgi:uncharacterized protein
MKQMSELALKSPKFFIWFPVFIMLVILTLVAIPTLSGKLTNILQPLTVDTDPESMLLYDNPVRVTHREQKKKFAIYDLMVVGITNTTHENGVFNAKTLSNVYDLVNYAKGLQWLDEDGNTEGVVEVELIAPSTMDNISQGGPGTVTFNWLMQNAPINDKEAIEVREKANSQPILKGSLTSVNGQALALYIPLTSKDISYKISGLLKEKVAEFKGEDSFFITGMATAQDTFGVEMFIQMAVTTPLAMMLIFGLLWFFFRNLKLVIAPMIIAMLSVMIAMGLMLVTGNPVHVLTSMVPIFIMPIAVLDGIHILSEFYDRYPQYNDRKQTIKAVMSELSMPMLLTTITTAVGFGALTLIPLPPLQVLGTFVCIGVIVAWLLTMTLIPAYIMRMNEQQFDNFGNRQSQSHESGSFLTRILPKVGSFSVRGAIPIVLITFVVSIVFSFGALKLIPNDNPMKWFDTDHEIRQADKILNEQFAGSYMAYLSLNAEDEQTFKDPDVLNYISGLQDHVNQKGVVGKTIALTEIIKIVHRELFGGDESYYRIPDSNEAVAQTLLTFQNSHRPDDLWHYVTPDYKEANIWFQLKSGDNQDMIVVEKLVDEYFNTNPPPANFERKWFGMTHINVVWQNRVTVGVVKAFSVSFVIILITLIVLFRSFLWGLLAMIPLAFSVVVIYGAAGFITGNLDTPLAILSAISIGLSVDYAIHFVTRSRELRKKFDSWKDTLPAVFGEPARAISRNVIVVGIGFLPLLITPLVPYQMVGILLSSILVLAGIATLVILPALIYLFEKQLFRE